jgi:TPR repeat protein
MKGYHVSQNTSEAIKYFKQAADANMPEAQYHYANAIKIAKKSGFLEYFTKAAENGCAMAQRELGLIYYYGNRIEADKAKGLQYLRLAALKDDRAAIDELKKMNLDF